MALTKLLKDLIDGSLGTDWQSTVKTADFTAEDGQRYTWNEETQNWDLLTL